MLNVGCTSIPVSPSSCIENTIDVKVVKIDYENKRLFVSSNTVRSEKIKSNLNELKMCFSSHKWKGLWSLSLFSESKYAGYKDEESIIQYHSDNSWATAYIAEYDSENNILTSSPALHPIQTQP